jgi:hypothetical protein
MISNRDLKDQIDVLTEQNEVLTQELQQMKDFMLNQAHIGNQTDNYDTSGNSMNDIASDFVKLKDLTNKLETKMHHYVASHQKSASLTEEDVINLVLNMMNGMIDWTLSYVSQQNNQPSL